MYDICGLAELTFKIMKNTILTICLFTIVTKGLQAQNDKAIPAFSKSIELEKKQDYPGAIESITKLGDTASYDVNVRLGWLYYKAGYKKLSLMHYEKAINLSPKAIEPRYGFGFPAYALEEYKGLIEQDKKILELDPNNRTINGNLGALYYYNKNYTSALPYLEKVVSQYPFDYDNNLLLGWTYLKLGKNENAEQCFNTVLHYSPKDASATDGLNTLKRTQTINPNVLTALTKSYEFYEKADYKNAALCLKEVYDKTSYVLNLRLGWLNYIQGQYMEAIGYYKLACELKPASIESKIGLADACDAMGNKNDSKSTYEAILTIDPKNTYTHYRLGVMEYEKKNYQAADAHFTSVLELYPCDTDCLLMTGWTRLQMGKTTEATSFFNKVLCFSPNNNSALQGLNTKPASQTKKPSGF